MSNTVGPFRQDPINNTTDDLQVFSEEGAHHEVAFIERTACADTDISPPSCSSVPLITHRWKCNISEPGLAFTTCPILFITFFSSLMPIIGSKCESNPHVFSQILPNLGIIFSLALFVRVARARYHCDLLGSTHQETVALLESNNLSPPYCTCRIIEKNGSEIIYMTIYGLLTVANTAGLIATSLFCAN